MRSDVPHAAAVAAPAASLPASAPAAPVRPRPVALAPRGKDRRATARERRRADRRVVDLGSPYGTERRSGYDDRQGDRRGEARRAAGIGLTRDYFSQSDARVTIVANGLEPHQLIRFHD